MRLTAPTHEGITSLPAPPVDRDKEKEKEKEKRS